LISDKKRERRAIISLAALGGISSGSWVKPIVNAVVMPAHAQTSAPVSLCQDGISTWVMSDYIENGIAFDQGSPPSQVQITISGSSVNLVVDWYVINSSTSVASRGRVTDSGIIDLVTGAATTSPTNSPTLSPTHGGVENLANNLSQSFNVDCSAGADFLVTSDSGIYSFRLSRVA
jgi:hypothetical protein